MKNILLMLLLANILYFMWGLYVVDEPQPGVDVVSASDFGPPMDVTTGRDTETIASVGAMLDSSEISALQAVVGRACVSINRFPDRDEANVAVGDYMSQGMKAAVRVDRGEIFVGHWVWIRNIEDEDVAIDMLVKLQEGGLNDAYIDRSDPQGLKISLGLFGERDGAERIELQALSLGLPAETIASTRDGDVFLVDIGLPPGKGAGDIVERYGQERVLLRDAATCP